MPGGFMPDLKQAYILAIQSEVMSQNLYKMLSAAFSRKPEVSAVFDNLIPLERLHEEKLRTLFDKEFPGATLKIDPNLVHQATPEEIDEPRKVLEFAISREIIAHDIYHNMAQETSDPETAKLLKTLAIEEDYHKTVLETEILRLEHLMTWFDPSELNGLVED